ncbi:MAG: hypothetical protein EGR85_06270 [Subdoligranulum sp.]|nr:hypothetical protein [Subdoligranulum sp.]
MDGPVMTARLVGTLLLACAGAGLGLCGAVRRQGTETRIRLLARLWTYLEELLACRALTGPMLLRAAAENPAFAPLALPQDCALSALPLPALPSQPLQLAVKGSAEGSVPLDYSALPETILLEKGAGAALRGELTLPETLEAPVERGQAVGKVSVYQGENLLSEYEVRAAVDAAKLTLPDALHLLWESLTGVS